MKKFFAVFMAAMLVLGAAFMLVSCGEDGGSSNVPPVVNPDAGDEGDKEDVPPATDPDAKVVNIYLPDGTPAFAVANVFTNGLSVDGYKVEFHIVKAAEIATIFKTHADADFAIMPTVGAAKVFTKGMPIQLVSTHVFGNLYIASVNSEAAAVEGLKGKTIYVPQAPTTRNLVQYILTKKGIVDQVTVEYKNSEQEIVAMMQNAKNEGKEVFGVFGEPTLTNAQNKISGMKVAVDLQKEWKEQTGFDGYPQASLIVRNTFPAENKEFIVSLSNALKGNGTWLSENIAAFTDALKAYNEAHKDTYQTILVGSTYTKETILRCNLGYKTAAEIKDSVRSYVKEFGIENVDDSFFYAA